MIHVNVQNTVVPKRIDPIADTDDHADHKRYEECHHIRISFLFCQLINFLTDFMKHVTLLWNIRP